MSMVASVSGPEMGSAEGGLWTRPFGPNGAWTAADVVAGLRRSWPLMLTVFLTLFLLGAAAAWSLKRTYTASSSLLVRLGQEYVYNPRVGDAARGAVPEVDQVIQSETEILNSAGLKEKVIDDIGLRQFSPKLADKYGQASAVEKRTLRGELIKEIGTKLKVVTAPDTAVVRLSYADPNPELSATVLNTLVDEYLNFRKIVLADKDATVIGEQRRAFQGQLGAVNDDFGKFLRANGISDFDTEKASLAQLYGSLLTENYAVQAQLSEVEGRLGATTAAVAQAPAEIGLYHDVDHVASDQITQLKLQRQDILSRYRPGSGPARDIEQKLAALEAANAAGRTSGPGARRVGINPIHQTLETDRNQLQAQAASLRNRKGAVAAELAQVTARRAHLTDIEPQYQDLARQRDVLAGNVRTFSQREQESTAAEAVAQRANDNVRVVERAYVPTKGVSLRKPVLALSFLFAIFGAFCAGLLNTLLARGDAQRWLRMPAMPRRKVVEA